MLRPFVNFSEINDDNLNKEILAFTAHFLANRQYILGSETQKFEDTYAKLNSDTHTTQQCVALSNGLQAIVLMLQAYGIGNGDEVIIPANTYIATVLAVSLTGATPILVDPDPATFMLSSEGITNCMTPNTKAVIAVTLYGLVPNMESIAALCQSKNILLFEDNAQGHGAKWKGKLTVNYCTAAATSFYPTKNLGAMGDSGAILCPDLFYTEKLKKLRNYGSSTRYHNELIGTNARPSEWQMGILNLKLKYQNIASERRFKRAGMLTNIVNYAPKSLALYLPNIPLDSCPVYHQFVVLTPKRSEAIAYFNHLGIPTDVHYPTPIYHQEAYAGQFMASNYPITSQLTNDILSLSLGYDYNV